MTFEILATLAAVIVLLALSAFFSGSETAMTAASRARMNALEREGNPRARLVAQLMTAPERLIGAILIGNNLVNILASALATSLFLALFGQAGVAYATFAMTTLVVVFAEVLPKTYAISRPERLALAVAPVLQAIVTALAPLAQAVQAIVGALLGMRGEEARDALVSAREEIRGAIDLHHRAGKVVKDDRDMLGGVLDLRELEVVDVMVHRTKMESLNADDPPQRIVDQALKSPYSRLPVWKDEAENFVGVLHVKNLMREYHRVGFEADKIDILALATEPWFVPDTTDLRDQLKAFLRRKSHFALVVDEYGEVMGLITLEDILEEIVGQIADEHDVTDTGIRPQPDGSVNVDGIVPVRDLNRAMDWRLPEDVATTIAGLVIHEAQTIPEPGQVFTFHGFRFEILRKQRNQITAIRVTPVDALGKGPFVPRTPRQRQETPGKQRG